MSVFLSDQFTFNAGDPLSGHTPELGLPWTALTGADAINWGGTKIGELNSLPNISGYTCNPTVPPQADYHARVQFVAGNSVFGMSSIGFMIRLQQAVFTGLLDFYYLRYVYTGNWNLAKVNQTGSGAHDFGNFAMALNVGQTYIVDMGIVGSTITVTVDGTQIFNVTDGTPFGLTAAGHVGILTSNTTPAFTSSDGWWIDNLIAYDGTLGAEFGLYFAGSGSFPGEDFTPIQYGVPTPITVNNPVAGTEYAIGAIPLDLAGFMTGKMGSIKLRRSTPGSNMVLRAISLQYKKIKT